MRRIDKETALRLLDEHAHTHTHACWMCALVQADAAATIVNANDQGIVVLNRFARREGHLMVIAREHVEHGHELAWSTYAELQRLVHDASRALHRAFQPARVFTASLGSPLPLANSFPHFHVHVIPIAEHDDRARPARVFSWTEGVVVYDDAEAAALTQRLRDAHR